jgi:hypothetical protein
MTYYQAYLVGRDGSCIKTIDVICADDEAAVKRALKMVDGHDVELWHTPVRLQSSTAIGQAIRRSRR